MGHMGGRRARTIEPEKYKRKGIGLELNGSIEPGNGPQREGQSE